MSEHPLEERCVKATLTCGKCGSKAIVSENGNESMPQRIRALKCLICGNRQEQGAPCRWPFFKEETGDGGEGEAQVALHEARPERGIELRADKKPRRLKSRPEETKRESIERELSI